jgi:hypothetical protein
MATTTTNFGWDIPQSTDLVKDGATAIAALGQDIDTALIDLKGGTTGQVLAKASGTDLDFSWVAQDDSNAIQNAIVDAKGDLIAATANDTPARLAVGANGTVLTADSAEATGLKWAAPASGSTFVGAQVTNTSAQSISNGTYTALNFQSEVYDTDGFHDNSVNNTRLTIPTGKGGKYLLTCQANFASNSSGFRAIAIMKNGSASQIAYANSNPISGSSFTYAFSCVVSAVATDYFEMNVYQSSGGSLNVNSGSDSTRFDISYLGA